MPMHDLRRVDCRAIAGPPGEIRAFLCVRDEIDRLPWLLEHHRGLGVHRFLVIDNGSRDGTAEFVLAQPDAHLFAASGSYEQARNGIDWIEALLHVYGQRRWCLVLDADEQFIYPDCETVTLARFCRALSESGRDCLPTQFIDLYADAPILQTHLAPDVPPLVACPYFDASGYVELPVHASGFPRVYGGPRARLFWPEIDLASRVTASDAYLTRAFKEAEYLTRNADVALQVQEGRLPSGLAHFIRYGHLEDRIVSITPLPDWPEDIYLKLHSDVREGISNGMLRSGLEHYVRYGYFEGRPLWASAPPCLTQVPLVYWREGCSVAIGRHSLSGTATVGQHVVGGALLHFRLVDSLVARSWCLPDDADQDSVWASENRRYRQVLACNPAMSCMAPASVRYRDSRQLVELGLVAPSPLTP